MRSKSSGRESATQLDLWPDEGPKEFPDFYTRQLITYIGNKRALLGPISKAVERVQQRLGRNKLRILDAFAGTGVVSRYMKSCASYLASNDLEQYSAIAARCFLSNRSRVDEVKLRDCVADLNRKVDSELLVRGFIEELYSPRDDENIEASERVFYTRTNARRLDNYRRLIDKTPPVFHDLLLGPLLGLASVHANTAGVFKGFYKDRITGIGRFGGTGADALSRIRGRIELMPPVLSRFECDYEVFQEDANALVRRLKGLDLVYLDPPYNQHPYGSNYFMLNLIARYARPANISDVSGIPTDWNRSGYNVRSQSLPLIQDLITSIDARFILLSFNDEGFVDPGSLRAALSRLGLVEVIETSYNAFRGSRNLKDRPIHVTEQLFLIERK